MPRWQDLPERWRGPALQLGLVWLTLLASFASDWAAMFDQWWNSSTYNHVLLVIPIVGWLIWQRWPQLSVLSPRPWRWGIAAFAGAVLLWALGSFAGFNLLRQTGAVAMLPASALVILGPRAFAALLFPFAYMAFIVPFGDELVPPLQTITAKLTIGLVNLSAIPARIDGVFIDTPAGLFEVAEACSGVKFLIAMIALGVLVGNVCFKSWLRRIAFLALCIIVPILANGVRAWGTIYIAQYVGAEKAAGVDHLIYGWVFFAVVIAAVMAIGWRFFDRDPREPMVDLQWVRSAALFDRLDLQTLGAPLAAALLAGLVFGGIGWAWAADALHAKLPQQIFLPEVTGWKRVPYKPLAAWEPQASGANHRLLGRFEDAAGNQVDVFYALYAAQEEGGEAGGFGQGALTPNSSWAWASTMPAIAGAKSERLLSGGQIERLAQTWYRTGSLLTGSNTHLKLANIQDRLVLRVRPTAMLIVSAESRPGRDAAKAMAAFVGTIGDPGQWMDRIGEGR
ncbi:exosortase A [Novosphingobium sp.]|uniref:exosortase A n=1 Tax=Novosphingobium sp. TaxID=1874826 RepID=UPI0037045255